MLDPTPSRDHETFVECVERIRGKHIGSDGPSMLERAEAIVAALTQDQTRRVHKTVIQDLIALFPKTFTREDLEAMFLAGTGGPSPLGCVQAHVGEECPSIQAMLVPFASPPLFWFVEIWNEETDGKPLISRWQVRLVPQGEPGRSIATGKADSCQDARLAAYAAIGAECRRLDQPEPRFVPEGA